MPCASVSEKPTRVSDAYLNGGLRSVTRPSSSAMARILRGAAREWRQRAAAGARFTPAADVADDAPAGEPGEGAENDDEREREPGGAQPVRPGGAERDAARGLWREVAHRAHLRLVLRAERRERRHGHEGVDEPALADRAEIDVEDDR